MIDLGNINLTEALESKIDRSKWKSFKFSDLVENIVEKVVPKNSGLKYYIGLEHLDSGSLKIKRFGETESLIGDKLKIYKGDLIFAKRNSYLKRVAIAEFDAVASAHSMVLRPKSKNVDPNFLPFFMMSEVFWKRAIEISVGSLSPTINWKTLAKQEFLLPPKAEQARLAELLWAMDDVIEKEKIVLEKLISIRHSLNEMHFINFKSSAKRIGEFAIKVGSGVTPSGGSKVYIEEGVIFIRSQNVLNGEFDFSEVVFISDSIDEKMSATRVLKDDVLLNITGASIGRSSVYKINKRANVNQHVCIIRCNDYLEPAFLCEFLNSKQGQNQIDLYQAGGNREGLNFSNIRLMRIPDHDHESQKKLLLKYNSITNSRDLSRAKISASQSLQKSLINQIF